MAAVNQLARQRDEEEQQPGVNISKWIPETESEMMSRLGIGEA